jgi:hypothetical protein
VGDTGLSPPPLLVLSIPPAVRRRMLANRTGVLLARPFLILPLGPA